MENSAKLTQWLNSFNEFISEQSWFQQIKAKWDELDSKSRGYLKTGAFAGLGLLLLFILLTSVWSVHSLKAELSEKTELLNTIQNANDEMRKLRDTTPVAAAGDATGNWNSYFESIAGTVGIDKPAMTIADKPMTDKGPSDLAKESHFEIALKHVGIRQAVRLAFFLESGTRPVKLRSFTVDTKADPTGFLDATLAVSAFTLNSKQ